MVGRVVDLPAPLAPIRVTISPSFDGEGDALEGVDGAVIDVEILDFKQHWRLPCPDRPRSTLGLSWISFGVPRAITSPKSITVMCSQMPITTRIWCSISRIVRSKRSRMKWISSISVTISAGFIPAAGSSRSSRRRIRRPGRGRSPPVAARRRAGSWPARSACRSSLKIARKSCARSVSSRSLTSNSRVAQDGVDHPVAGMGMVGDADVIQHRQVGEEPDVLECAPDAQLGDLERLQADGALPWNRSRRRRGRTGR